MNTGSPLNQDSEQKSQSKSICDRSPLAEADKIVNQSRETRDKEYGGFTASMKRTAAIASELCNKEITTDDAFKMLMALKLSRLSYSPDHFDSFTDLMGYAEGWWKYREAQVVETFDIPHPHHKAKPYIRTPEFEAEKLKKEAEDAIAEAKGIMLKKELEQSIELLLDNGYQVYYGNAQYKKTKPEPLFEPEGSMDDGSMDWKDQH